MPSAMLFAHPPLSFVFAVIVYVQWSLEDLVHLCSESLRNVFGSWFINAGTA